MLAKFGPRVNLSSVYQPAIFYLERPYRLFRSYQRSHIRPDLIAGITVAVILLPQGIAFAFIAELPPQMGVYAAIVGAIFAALWGSSDQMQTGPTNSTSLLVFSSLSGIIAVGSPEYVVAAGMVALMAGLFQLAMGLARLGILVNFVSHSVIVGFASGASILIAIRQLQPLLGMNIPSDTIVGTLTVTFTNLNQVHWPTAVLGIGVMVFIVILRRLNPKLPSALISMILASVIVYILQLDKSGVSVIGQDRKSVV